MSHLFNRTLLGVQPVSRRLRLVSIKSRIKRRITEYTMFGELPRSPGAKRLHFITIRRARNNTLHLFCHLKIRPYPSKRIYFNLPSSAKQPQFTLLIVAYILKILQTADGVVLQWDERQGKFPVHVTPIYVALAKKFGESSGKWVVIQTIHDPDNPTSPAPAVTLAIAA